VPVFYSDATRVEVMRAAHADAAKVLVIAIPDQEISVHIAEMARKHFPHLRLYAFAKDRRHAMHLIDLGVKVIRRTYLSSLELTRQLLVELGTRPEQADRAVETFRRHDEETLAKQQAVFRDEQQLVQSARDAARELQDLFSTDRLDRRDS
jgi:voltage-gated potassium channel Kch